MSMGTIKMLLKGIGVILSALWRGITKYFIPFIWKILPLIVIAMVIYYAVTFGAAAVFVEAPRAIFRGIKGGTEKVSKKALRRIAVAIATLVIMGVLFYLVATC